MRWWTKAQSGAEQDWVTPWRDLVCYIRRPGVGRKLKRQMTKRGRKELERDTGEALEEV